MLFDQITSCNKCSLRKNCVTEPVLPISFNSKVMVIVEKPNNDASIIREPIDAEQWLFLKGVGLNNVYITSLVKCPGTVGASHIKKCWEYISKEIDVMEPTHIFAFGKKVQEALSKNGIKHIPFDSINNILNGNKIKHELVEQTIRKVLHAT